MAESRAGGYNIWWELRFVERLFGWGDVLLRNNVVDGLLHNRYFFIYRNYIKFRCRGILRGGEQEKEEKNIIG